jgi:hypothetical protein
MPQKATDIDENLKKVVEYFKDLGFDLKLLTSGTATCGQNRA